MSGAVTTDIAEALQGLRTDVQAMRSELRSDLGRLDTKLDTLRSELRSEMQAMRSEMHSDVGRLDGKIDAVRTQAHGDLWRILGAGAGALVASLVATAWMLQHLR